MRIVLLIALLLIYKPVMSQSDEALVAIGDVAATVTIVASDADKKEVAKSITQFRSKEYIVNHIIGPVKSREVKFETESLASDNSQGLISVAFNCDEVGERGLLLAFFGDNIVDGRWVQAYAFRYLPLNEAQTLLDRLVQIQERHKVYLNDEIDVNNIYTEYEDLQFIIYRDGGPQIRVLWNGFEVIWEKTAFNRTQRRLEKWFEKK